jgi:hypothetical protein
MAENKYGVLENVVLAYAKIAETTKKYQSEDTLYEVDCIVEKAVAKKWNKDFPKQKAKEFDLEDFKTKFKMDAPFDEGDEVYVIKLRKPASKDGEVYDEKFRPRVLLDMNDGERIDITVSNLISNGTKAKVSYRITENSFGVFGQLNNILTTEDGFKEYVNGGAAGSEFGDSKPTKVEPARKEATEARSNKDKLIPKEESEDSDLCPF